MKRLNITDVSMKRMPAIAKAFGFRPYAVGQIISWLYKKKVTSFDAMTNLSSKARELLEENYFLKSLKVDQLVKAKDGTTKFIISLRDDLKIESVLIPVEKRRLTLCASTQAGCAMDCLFCRTGRMGLKRDLTQGEILGQIIEAQRYLAPLKKEITNIVFMGMGEPFVNYAAVSDALEFILDERAFNFSKRRVTVSTSGLLPQMEMFAKRFDVKLAISLNATDDETRDKLMPINRRYPLAQLMQFSRDYSKRSKHWITFEYVMIRDINDTPKDMKRLVKLLHGVRAKVNLIPFNSFPGCAFKNPLESTIETWFEFLAGHGIQTNVRVSRGQDILAACGQLAA